MAYAGSRSYRPLPRFTSRTLPVPNSVRLPLSFTAEYTSPPVEVLPPHPGPSIDAAAGHAAHADLQPVRVPIRLLDDLLVPPAQALPRGWDAALELRRHRRPQGVRLE